MIGSLAPWYGSKRTLAPDVVRQLGPHRAYWEPFCGSLAVLFAKPPATYETVNDLHADLINLARVVQDEALAVPLYSRLYRTLFDERLLPEAKARLRADWDADAGPDPGRAYHYLVFSWMALNGVSGTPLSSTGTFAVRYSAKGGNGATRWRSVVESVPAWHERLRGVQVLRRDAFALLEKLDDADGTAVYCDPPYLLKSARYVHDFADGDHARLAALLRRFRRARVVVSYYDHPALADLYPGWWRQSCAAAKHMVNSGRRRAGAAAVAPEVLLVNGPLLRADGTAEGDLFGADDS